MTDQHFELVADLTPVRPLSDATWVASVLAVPKGRVYELCRQGLLPHVKLGRQVRFDPVAIADWIAAGGRGLTGECLKQEDMSNGKTSRTDHISRPAQVAGPLVRRRER